MAKNRKQASLTNVVQYDSNFNLSIGSSTSSSFNSSGSIVAASGFTGSLSGSVFGIGSPVSFSSSVSSDLINLESKSASVDISITNINSFTSSNGNTSLNQLTGSLATTGSNTFYGTQTYSGSVYIANDLVVQGSSSIQYISASSVSIGTNIVQLNTANPTIRYAGLTIIDSGSIGGSGSFLYDSVHDEFVFVHRGNGTNITSSHFVLGPETYDSLGNETYLTNNRLPKGTGKEHLVDSCIYHDNNTTCIYNGALVINSNCQFIFGTTPADFTFNVGTTCVGTNASIAQFYNNDYTAGTRGFIRVRNSANVSGTTSAYFGQGQDQKTYFYNNDTSRPGDIVITNTGNVGIGTSGPSVKFEVADGQIRVSGTTAQALYLYGAATVKPYITLNQFGVGDWHIAAGQSASNTLSLTKTIGCLDGIIINSSGHIGIGTASPAGLLEIKCAQSTYNRIVSCFEGSYTSGFAFSDLNGGIKYDAGNNIFCIYSTYPNYGGVMVQTGASQRMLITSCGSVNIGTLATGKHNVEIGDIKDGPGGFAYCYFLVAQGTWATFACVTNGDTNVVTDITYVNNNDYNRSGVFVARWAYNAACAALHIVSCLWNDSQNINQFGLRNNGGALQICLGGGSNGYRVQARVQGARATG